MRRCFGIIGLVLMLTAAVSLAVSYFLPLRDESRWAGANITTGQVAGFLQNGKARLPLVSFVAEDGIPYLFEANNAGSDLQQGQIVTVRYFLTPDLQAALIRDFRTAQLIYAIAGCTLAALGLTLLILQLRKSSLRKQLALYGIRVMATVAEIEPSFPISLFGRRLYAMTLTTRSPQVIGEIALKGKGLFKSGTELSPGSILPVLMDVSNPRHYVVLWEDAENITSALVVET